MKNYGSTFKWIRKSKGLTLSQTSDTIVTPQFLSQFENGKSNIGLDVFIQLLDKLNVTFNEFSIHHASNLDNDQADFLADLSHAMKTKNQIQLKDLIKKENHQLKQDNNIRHQHNLILLKQYLHLLDGKEFNDEQIDQIVSYLFETDNWCFYELTLFNNSLFCLPIEIIESMSRIAYNKAVSYQRLSINRHTLATVLMNVIYIFIEQNHSQSLPILFKHAEDTLNDTRYNYEKNRLNYLKGLYQIRFQNMESGQKQCQEAIRVMQHFGSYTSANSFQKELNMFLEEME